MALSDRIAGPGLVRRILSSLVLAPPVLVAVYFGSPWVELLLVLAAAEMAREWARLCDSGRAIPGGIVLAVGSIVAIALGSRVGAAEALAVVAATAALAFLLGLRRGRSTAEWLAAGAPVIALPCLAFLWLNLGTDDGWRISYWLLAAVWATDIGAYVVGRTVGGPRLWPRVSPGKTWSGLGGGIVAAGLVGFMTSWLIGSDRVVALITAGFVVAVISQLGDLAESAVKRRFGVKDAGKLIPGHGGLLDRVDGLIAAVPAVAVAVWAFGGDAFPWR
ncbi:MAG: phosphatidate cytidylyltransferase [Alphaproteobacteria bacterium]|nr:phosphatidate cytidylyltransferase [Alphaproteobacteria bacterium]